MAHSIIFLWSVSYCDDLTRPAKNFQTFTPDMEYYLYKGYDMNMIL